MSFKRIILAASALLLSASAALAQGAQFPAGTVWGNATAAQRIGKVETVTAILDRAFGSTRGSILMRGAAGWQLLTPGTAGLALTSAGAGADLVYAILGCNALPAFTGDVTKASASCATVLANIPNDTPAAGDILFTNIVAPSTPAAGKVRVYTDSTTKGLKAINDVGTLLTTVVPSTCSSSNWFNSLAATGVLGCAQPSYSDISGSIPNDTAAAGSILFTNIAAPATPSAGTVRMFADSTSKNMRMINDVGTLATMAAASTCSSNNWFNTMSTAGVFGCAQPAFSNLSGSVAASQMPALTGDCTTTAGTVATTCTKTNGVSFSAGATSGIVAVKIQTFCASGCTTTVSAGSDGTYTPSTGMVYAIAELCGGGGGGGGTANSSASAGSGGAGGGSGSYSMKLLTAAAVGASKNVRVGAAGTAGSAGNNAGGAGAKSCIGTGANCVTTTIVDANGGSGGGGSAGSGAPTPGAGGTAGTGDVIFLGNPGFGFPAISGAQGVGGAGGVPPALGGGGAATNMTATTSTGGSGGGCSGGAGGASFNAAGTAAGGAGGAGYVKIVEYTTQ